MATKKVASAAKKAVKKAAKTVKAVSSRGKKAKLGAVETTTDNPVARYVESTSLNTTTGGVETTRSLHI